MTLTSQRLNKNAIQALLDEKVIRLDIFDEINSTNTYLKSFCDTSTTTPHVCIADMQTSGYGRFNRHWHSPFGKNIYLSLLYPFHHSIDKLEGLSLVVGLTIIQAIEKISTLQEPLMLKWPNDVVVNQHKIAGTLIEVQQKTPNLLSLIIGIGINVNMMKDDSSITQAWTSLQQLSRKEQDRNTLCAALINTLLINLHQFEQQGLPPFIDDWNKKDVLRNKTVKLQSGDQTWEGIALGINNQGLLRLKLTDNSEQLFSSGDTSITKPIQHSQSK